MRCPQTTVFWGLTQISGTEFTAISIMQYWVYSDKMRLPMLYFGKEGGIKLWEHCLTWCARGRPFM